MKKKLRIAPPPGFSLAEVLITLGIIGVVAAITMPALIHKYKLNVLHNQFKQAYSILSQVHQQMLNDDIIPYEEFLRTTELPESVAIEHINTIARYLNASICNNHYRKCTGGKNYKILDGTSGAHIDPDAFTKKTILLNNGMTLWRGDLNWAHNRYYIDINGTGKGPNKLGYDLFTFRIDKNNKLSPEKDSGNTNKCSFTQPAQSKSYLGFGCAYYALTNEHPEIAGKSYWKDFLK